MPVHPRGRRRRRTTRLRSGRTRRGRRRHRTCHGLRGRRSRQRFTAIRRLRRGPIRTASARPCPSPDPRTGTVTRPASRSPLPRRSRHRRPTSARFTSPWTTAAASPSYPRLSDIPRYCPPLNRARSDDGPFGLGAATNGASGVVVPAPPMMTGATDDGALGLGGPFEFDFSLPMF